MALEALEFLVPTLSKGVYVEPEPLNPKRWVKGRGFGVLGGAFGGEVMLSGGWGLGPAALESSQGSIG